MNSVLNGIDASLQSLQGSNSNGLENDGIPIRFARRELVDGGGRIRVSNSTTTGYYSFTESAESDLVSVVTVGTGDGTYDSTNKLYPLTTSADADVAILQSKNGHIYQGGKSQQIEATFDNFQLETNVLKSVGYFSASTSTPFSANKDGVILESDGITNNSVQFRVVKNGTNASLTQQANWDDPLDGTGRSGHTVDWSKFTIIMIDFLLLGGSAFNLYVFNMGKFVLAHTYKHAGNVAGLAISNFSQPVRYEIRQSGAGTGTFNAYCAQVSTEGGLNLLGKNTVISMGGAYVNANSTSAYYALCATRLKSTNRFSTVTLKNVSILSTGANKDLIYQVRINPAVNGWNGTTEYSDNTNRRTQTAVGDTAGNPSTTTVTGGIVIAEGLVSSTSPENTITFTADKIGATADGTFDTMVLCVKPATSNQTVSGSMTLLEYL